MKKDPLGRPLFVFELANNHMGDVAHGVAVIRAFHEVAKDFPFTFAFKLQYRQLDTFIHPDPAIQAGSKYVKRFSETRLSDEQFLTLKREIDSLGFVSMCTPFDEDSVARIEAHDYDVVKVGSCSFTDWPLIERIGKVNKPIIVSTAGATFEEIDAVVSFFEHRGKKLSIMHCVAEYPCPADKLQLNQIDLLRARYPQFGIGFSTHEAPDQVDPVKMAIAKGAVIFEKHVGMKTDKFAMNEYSASPEQTRKWLEAAKQAFAVCGTASGRYAFGAAEVSSLRQLRRGVFAKAKIAAGEKITAENSFLAIPTTEGQITANDLSKYTVWTAVEDIPAGQPVRLPGLRRNEVRGKVHAAVQKVKAILKESRTVIPGQLDLELSHHYGVDRFEEFGIAMMTYVNRDYCKKVIVVLPGQQHPEQWHKVKEETFHLVWGDLTVKIDGVERTCKPGDIVLVERGARHWFTSKGGAVIEELSSTHHGADSFYTDETIMRNKDRKTYLTYWLD